MGREVRRVPANWQHPKYTADTCYRREQIGEYIPLHDNYDQAIEKFAKDIEAMGLREAIEYHGGGPLADNYTQYEARSLDWYQAYETVSEGTPVSPAFATPEELIEYLVKTGDDWGDGRPYSKRAAEEFVRGGRAPTAMIVNGEFKEGAEGLV